ncbi:uncharacterized protein FFB20_10404 [Fusarium fujikuroi]|nr:uncharacterized protein FFB20_10404 [Fusarium fujikuroi]SCO11051.1 uncharacterized protein FFC1_11350 [Fusarium fujikuroi]SCO13540.1 uncharacterized protein FFE2_12858 [Fusarium fujikuroi]SCO18216.1 uncharacterized protein FFM5_11782 [Fusarium fujikuroi]SCO40864.1 uncharacterized protein FFNC_07728 [Fusarium fujikuroi]
MNRHVSPQNNKCQPSTSLTIIWQDDIARVGHDAADDEPDNFWPEPVPDLKRIAVFSDKAHWGWHLETQLAIETKDGIYDASLTASFISDAQIVSQRFKAISRTACFCLRVADTHEYVLPKHAPWAFCSLWPPGSEEGTRVGGGEWLTIVCDRPHEEQAVTAIISQPEITLTQSSRDVIGQQQTEEGHKGIFSAPARDTRSLIEMANDNRKKMNTQNDPKNKGKDKADNQQPTSLTGSQTEDGHTGQSAGYQMSVTTDVGGKTTFRFSAATARGAHEAVNKDSTYMVSQQSNTGPSARSSTIPGRPTRLTRE